ncbi:hypothetical protein [Gordonia neofelifaecis]|nr:hypothetical protein [Gordonia neofelifaecis]
MDLSLRAVYDEIEKRVTPVVEDVVRSDEFATANTVAGQVRGAVVHRIQGVAASVLHLVNLPAGTDVRKLRRQVGELDYEVRQLRMEVAERAHSAVEADDEDGE